LINWANTNLLHPVRQVVLLDYTSLAAITQTRRMLEWLVNTEFKIKREEYVEAYSEAGWLYWHFCAGSDDTNEILSIDNRFLSRTFNAGPPS
jgi:hypothetical protein